MGKPTTFADVKRLAIEINALYLARGHLTARAFVPSQRVAEGNLKVQLIEAQLSAVVMPPKTRLSKDFLEAVIATPVGSLIDGPAISERLTRLHRGTPDNRIALDFAASESRQAGLSVIKIDTEEPPRWTAKLAASNEGADSLGKTSSAPMSRSTTCWPHRQAEPAADRLKGSVSANAGTACRCPGPSWPGARASTWACRMARPRPCRPASSRSSSTAPRRGQPRPQPAAVAARGLEPGWRPVTGLTQSATDIQKERFSDIHTARWA